MSYKSGLNPNAPSWRQLALESIPENKSLESNLEIKKGLADFIYDERRDFISFTGYDLLQLMKFHTIDGLLAQYYANFGIQYYFNDYKVGRFLGFVIGKQLCKSIDLDCEYMNWEYINFDVNFPVDENILKLTDGCRQSVCHCVLQHCLRYNILPDKAYIKKNVVMQLPREYLIYSKVLLVEDLVQKD